MMRRKHVGLLVPVLVVAVLAAGCLGGGSKKSGKSHKKKSANASAAAFDAAASAQPITGISPPRGWSKTPVAPKFGAPPAGTSQTGGPAPSFAKPAMPSNSLWQKLRARAKKKGSVPIIVTLNVAAVPEGRLPLSARGLQRKRIASTRQSLFDQLQTAKVSNVKTYGDVTPIVAMWVDPKGLDVVRHAPQVAGVEEDKLIPLDTGTTTGQAGSPQATSGNTSNANWWDLYRTNAVYSWQHGYDGRGQTVAILDTGVQNNHPWLNGKVVSEACYSTTGSTTAGGCPNGLWSQYGTGAARPCTYSTSCKHGTHVAGTAAGIYGVANAARIIAISVFHRDPASGKPLSYTSDQIWGLWRVYNLRTAFPIASVNLSIGGGGYTTYCDDRAHTTSFYSWAAQLRSVGIATVVSSGNDNFSNKLSSPACNSDVISVGNTTLTPAGADAVYGGVAGGSNSASFLSVLAPGTQICSSVPTSAVECGWIGTSMAAPHVTGAIAVLRQLRPRSSVPQALASLQYGGVSVTDSRNNVTKARLNVWGALVYMANHY